VSLQDPARSRVRGVAIAQPQRPRPAVRRLRPPQEVDLFLFGASCARFVLAMPRAGANYCADPGMTRSPHVTQDPARSRVRGVAIAQPQRPRPAVRSLRPPQKEDLCLLGASCARFVLAMPRAGANYCAGPGMTRRPHVTQDPARSRVRGVRHDATPDATPGRLEATGCRLEAEFRRRARILPTETTP
jgi:hypothetical protein